MRILDITIKDLRQASRSLTIYFFMFVVPILVTLLFRFMFGGVGGEESGFSLPKTTVVVANLDQGRLPAGFGESVEGVAGAAEAESMGGLLLQVLGNEAFADLMEVEEASDETAARAAVDNQEADVAVILPADFTQAMMESDVSTQIALYQDPTLTIGPAIVESVVRQLVDGFAAGKIGMSVTLEGLAGSGVAISPELTQEVLGRLTSDPAVSRDPNTLVTEQTPPGEEEPGDILTEIVTLILTGMMVFFAFYTAAASIETILVEEERGTLARLFTTPTSHREILSGKALAGVITVTIQIVVLMIFGRYVFNIRWGDPLPVLLAGIGVVILTASTGIFLVSLLKNTRQGGIIFGGVLTITGMLGMIPIFTSGVPNQPEAVQTAALFVPQGWAIRGLTTALDGGGAGDVLPVLGVVLLWSAVFAFIGQYRIQKRFA